MGNTVIFLGAGASKADGAPLQNELFSVYVDWVNSREKSWQQQGIVKEFFNYFFGIDDIYIETKAKFPTFEEALGVLDLAISKKEKYKNMKHTLEKYRVTLVFAMAKAIQYKLDVEPKDDQRKSLHHTKLIKRLVENNQYAVSFISTNYDLIIDNIIYNNQQRLEYGLEYKDHHMVDRYKLYKIHGSLNWLYCPVCNSLSIGGGSKSMLDIIDKPSKAKCNSCETIQEAIIVPPTYFKDMTNPILSQVWLSADKELRNTDHIVFCGYSFPAADIHIKYLLKRAELNRNVKYPLRVTVINNHKAKKNEEKIEEEARFKRFFSYKTNVDYTEMDFETFVNDPISVIDAAIDFF